MSEEIEEAAGIELILTLSNDGQVSIRTNADVAWTNWALDQAKIALASGDTQVSEV